MCSSVTFSKGSKQVCGKGTVTINKNTPTEKGQFILYIIYSTACVREHTHTGTVNSFCVEREEKEGDLYKEWGDGMNTPPTTDPKQT